MRQAIIPLILVTLTGCMTTGSETESYAKANSVMAAEISRRIQDIQFQHRTELLDNLMWLAQSGEQAIPYLVTALRHDDPKVRANSAWVLGRIKDRRVIPDLQQVASDANPTVRMEMARTLVALGDLKYAPALIEGLDSDRPAVRYNCHQALKEATSRDFGYDHLAENAVDRQRATLRWRQWWGEQFNDRWFAESYAQANNLGNASEQSTATPPMPLTEPAPGEPGTNPTPAKPQDNGKPQDNPVQGGTDPNSEVQVTPAKPANPADPSRPSPTTPGTPGRDTGNR